MRWRQVAVPPRAGAWTLALAFVLVPFAVAANGVADPSAVDAAPAAPTTAAVAVTTPGAPSGAERAAVLAALGSWDAPSFLDAMEADRLLLYEARKDLPQERAEADTYLQRLKDLAVVSDPVRLVPRVVRLIEQAPTYYDWVEKSAKAQSQAQQAQAQNEYTVSGARGFIVAFQEFQDALMLTVINRLEIAARALRGAVGLSPG